jgi:hypothetical protein
MPFMTNLHKGLTTFEVKITKSLLRMAVVLACTASTFAVAQQSAPVMPMKPDDQNGAEYRWLHKKVLDSRLLDGMDDLSHW